MPLSLTVILCLILLLLVARLVVLEVATRGQVVVALEVIGAMLPVSPLVAVLLLNRCF